MSEITATDKTTTENWATGKLGYVKMGNRKIGQ